MTELEMLKESKLLDLFKYIARFAINSDETLQADPWAPWPFP